MPVRLPPGLAKLVTRPVSTVDANVKNDRNCRGCALRRLRRRGAAARAITSTLRSTRPAASRHPIIAPLAPAVFDGEVLSLDVAGFSQSLVEVAINASVYGPAEPELRKPIPASASAARRP